ncbi:MAG: hypothetical protein ACE5G2_06520 [Candidatus Krumholzibacteriia bacterium]
MPRAGRRQVRREEAAGHPAVSTLRHPSCTHRVMMQAAMREILRRLERDDPLGLGESCGVRWEAERLEERRYSSIYVLRSGAAGQCVRERLGSENLVLKVYRAAQPERRQREFDDLCRVYDGLAQTVLTGVVRPVACFAELGAILTACAPGEAAGPLMRRACRRGGSAELLARAAALCTAAATWLRTFQKVGRERVRGQTPRHLGRAEDFLAYIDERMRILCRQRLGVEPALRTRILAHTAAVLNARGAAALADVTWSHADFGPHNLLADGDRLTVLDFELAPEHPYFDAAYFIESLAGLRGPLVDPTRVRRLERAFLSAYRAPADDPFFELFRLRHLLCTYVSQSRLDGLARLRAWPGLLRLRARLQRFPDALALGLRPAATWPRLGSVEV